MKVFQRIRVFSYLECVRNVANYKGNSKIAIISLQDANGFGFQFVPSRNVVDVLTIYCDDADTERKTICAEKRSDFESVSKQMKLFSADDANNVLNFVNKNKDIVDEIWVHCYAGVSRSQATAAAISKFFFNDDDVYFRAGVPNKRIYRMILEAFFTQDNQ